MAIVMRVSDVLLTTDPMQTRKLDQIDFSLDGIKIDAAGLREVGRLMVEGRIHIEVGDTGTTLSAAYTPHSNTMSVGQMDRPPSDVWRAGIVHESVHALVDLRKTRTTELNDETVAYIAEAIYIRAGGIWITPGDPAAAAILNAARNIVEGHQLHVNNGVELTSNNCRALQAAILSHTAYSGADRRRTTQHGIE